MATDVTQRECPVNVNKQRRPEAPDKGGLEGGLETRCPETRCPEVRCPETRCPEIRCPDAGRLALDGDEMGLPDGGGELDADLGGVEVDAGGLDVRGDERLAG